jgi:CheY-like chemotaxis protein
MMSVVLVVDDEPGFLIIMQAILERAGHKVLCAEHGAEGLAMARQHHPDVILLDEMMPGMTGGEVCTRLKADPTTRSIAVVMHSASPGAVAPAYIKQIGADGALLKPCLPVEILKTVATYARTSV